jgi:hypothetical protein
MLAGRWHYLVIFFSLLCWAGASVIVTHADNKKPEIITTRPVEEKAQPCRDCEPDPCVAKCSEIPESPSVLAAALAGTAIIGLMHHRKRRSSLL